jgi:DNA (cytosine-5)-methyltransferase 1
MDECPHTFNASSVTRPTFGVYYEELETQLLRSVVRETAGIALSTGTKDKQMLDAAPLDLAERFGKTGSRVWREIVAGVWTGPRLVLEAKPRGGSSGALRSAWDQAWLRGALAAPMLDVDAALKRPLRVVDLFAGCGAMSLGLKMAADALGMHFSALLCADFEASAMDVYRHNFGPAAAYRDDLAGAIDFELATNATSFTREPRLLDVRFQGLVGKVDVLIGGPPCQGHSDLNNHSRRNDPKNSLYLLMPAFAHALVPPVVIIENVPAVVHDSLRVVEKTEALLTSMGYGVTSAVVAMDEIGIAQRRRRHMLVATRPGRVDLVKTLRTFATRPRSLCWAIGDLADRSYTTTFNTPSSHFSENEKRIAWLFKKDKYDLPNQRRPDCHKEKDHSYKSMYGRMRWNEPAQTITTGFGSPGQGRYIHPRRRRVITPHEAARLQYLPDSFAFWTDGGQPGRTKLALMIGNAVPPKLTYIVGLAAISTALGLELLPR